MDLNDPKYAPRKCNNDSSLFCSQSKTYVAASTLYIVIVIALVIGILCSSVILIGYNYKQQVYDNNLLKKLESNANSGIQWMLSEEHDLSFDQDSLIDLYDEESDSLMVKRTHWGIYETAIVKAFSGRYSLTRIWMYGYAPGKQSASAIYLADHSRPLSISGTTLIKGNCFLPEAGVKRAYVEGQSFQGDDLVQGTISKSDKMLPVLDTTIVKKLVGYLQNHGQDTADSKALLSKDTITQSFLEPTLTVYLKKTTRLTNKVLTGNLLVICDTVLCIDSTSKLKDILLIASGIKFENGFSGCLQVFAKDSIVTGEECHFTFPTAFGLFKVDHQTTQPFIQLGKGSTLTGLLFSQQIVPDLLQTLIRINEGAVLTGQAYAEGFLDIKGSVYGNAMCNKFLLKTPSTVYENHLLNATIDFSKLPAAYSGSAILPIKSKKQAIKFLD